MAHFHDAKSHREYQKMPQSRITDQPMAPQDRDTDHL